MGLYLLQINYFLKRLGAWYYKEYRDVYELHKSCFVKFGCTFIFVLIQILCDKNYSFKKRDTIRKSNKKINSTSNQKTQMKNSIELNCSSDVLENELFLNQPREKTMSHSMSCYPKTPDRVTFNNETLKFPPSFNLQSNQKSTPKPLANSPFGQNNQTVNNQAISTFHTGNTSSQNVQNHATSTFQTANNPSQTVVSIETNANLNQSLSDIETIV